MQTKAGVDQLKRLEQQLTDYVRVIEFNDLKNTIQFEYAKRDDLLRLSRTVDKINEYTQKLVTVEMLSQRVGDHDAQVKELLKRYAKCEEVEQLQTNLSGDMETLKYRTNYANT